MVIRLLIVQYAGDYRKAFKNFEAGGGEAFYAQKHSVEVVAEIGRKVDQVATLCCFTSEAYKELLSNGTLAIGAGFKDKIQTQKLIQLVEEFNPTHLIVRTPIRELIQWAVRRDVKTLVVLADFLKNDRLRDRFRNYLLANLLNKKQVTWVGNCNLPASISLEKIGVDPNKIIPWEWPAMIHPASFSPKALEPRTQGWTLAYVGQLTPAKGLDDVLEAVRFLKAEQFPIRLKVAGGTGDLNAYQAKIQQLGIHDQVELLGAISNTAVLELMRSADVVVVPSRHDYPEGFPKTAVEALCSRTPLIASNHPVFEGVLENGVSAAIFPSGNAEALAACVKHVLTDAELYSQLSTGSYEAWEKLQIPVKWADLVNCWLFDSSENQDWLFQHRLCSERYSAHRLTKHHLKQELSEKTAF